MENHVGRRNEADREGLERLRAWRAILRQLLREAGVVHSANSKELLRYIGDPGADVSSAYRVNFLRSHIASGANTAVPPGVYRAARMAAYAGLDMDMVLATVVAVWPGGYDQKTMELHVALASKSDRERGANNQTE